VGARILGIDPGSRATGYALIEARGPVIRVLCHDQLRPSPSLPFHTRLLWIADGLGALVEEYAPAEAAVEDLFHSVNPRSALQLAHLRGAILLELARRKVALFTYAPRAVKKAVTGVGSASKEQVRAMLERLLHLRLKGHSVDVSDALAVALCHAHSREGVRCRR
jgi:crossover junction endodeoxyribonuclease RuvC